MSSVVSSVVEDARAVGRWRRRAVAAWAAAVTAVGGGVAALWMLVWRYPIDQPTLMLWVALAALGGLVGPVIWVQATGRHRAPYLTWRESVATPYGSSAGWTLRRPIPLGNKPQRSASIAATIGVVPVAAGTVTGATPMWLAVTGAVCLLPASVAAVWHTAHLLRLPAGIALTPDGIVTVSGLIRWDAITEVTLRRRWRRGPTAVRLRVDGRRRPVTLATSDYAMPVEELAEMIRGYRAFPGYRHVLGRPER